MRLMLRELSECRVYRAGRGGEAIGGSAVFRRRENVRETIGLRAPSPAAFSAKRALSFRAHGTSPWIGRLPRKPTGMGLAPVALRLKVTIGSAVFFRMGKPDGLIRKIP